MISIFATIVLTAVIVGGGLYLWFRSVITDVTNTLELVEVDLRWASAHIDDLDARNLVALVRQRILNLVQKIQPTQS